MTINPMTQRGIHLDRQLPIHGAEEPASERVIEMHRKRFGDEYRMEAEGPHPVASLRQVESEVR